MKVFRITCVYAACLAVLAIFLAPIAWVVVISLKMRGDIFTWPPTFFGFKPTMINYVNVLSGSSKFLLYLGNSLIVASVSTVVAVCIGTLGAFALSGRRKRSSKLWSYWMLSFRMMPPVALIIPYYFIYQKAGMLGSLSAIAISHSVFSVAVVLWMTKNFFDEVPSEIEEAAIVDGASEWQTFRYIIVPMAKAAIAASLIFAFLTSWNEFLFSAILSNTKTYTAPVAISSFVGEVYVSWGELAAATIIGILPALVVVFFGQRYLLVGLAPGAVK